MALRDVLQAGKIRADLDETNKELTSLKAVLVETGRLELLEIPLAIARLQEEKCAAERALEAQKARAAGELAEQRAKATRELETQIAGHERKKAALEGDVAGLNRTIAELRREVVAVEDAALLQSFGLYKPKYALQNSDAYRARLEEIRAKQASMVKSGYATSCPQNWVVNNSKTEGARMVSDYSKLVLRAFNNECDAAMIDVKFSNVEAIEKRIRKAFETLNRLTQRMNIELTTGYLKLKLEELHLCHEYQVKKQEEKEEQKRLREQLREEARVAREIEDAKEKLAKEQKHFAQALAALDARLLTAVGEVERAALEREKASVEQKLTGVARDMLDVLKREQNTRAGYVYVISNIGAFGDNVFKIGVTRRLEPRERIDELGDSSVPFDFDIHTLVFSDDAPALETALHRAFATRRLNMINGRREFFNVTLDEIEKVIRDNFSKPVEVVRLPDAAEYRQSLKLRNGNAARAFVTA